jgi:HEAT repeat protein
VTPWTPRASIAAACTRLGRGTVVAGCAALLRGQDVDSVQVGADLVVALGGGAARELLATDVPDVNRYWLRVWAARGLLWAWAPEALPELLTAFDDEHWRVREMALTVVARHAVDEALDGAVRRLDDPVPRVRAAAERAVGALTADAGRRPRAATPSPQRPAT